MNEVVALIEAARHRGVNVQANVYPYSDPFRYSEGIEYVMVNGQVVIDQGIHTGARPGRALRHRLPGN